MGKYDEFDKKLTEAIVQGKEISRGCACVCDMTQIRSAPNPWACLVLLLHGGS